MSTYSDDNDLDRTSMDQRTRLLSSTEILNDSTKRLQDSHRVALEIG
jgi:vesicle transport through interaction with t-SNAREs protein 1